MTPGRRLRYAEFAPRFVIVPEEIALWQPTIVDIGFGGGESVVAAATNRPDERILGVDVHEAGAARVLEYVAGARVADARGVLAEEGRGRDASPFTDGD